MVPDTFFSAVAKAFGASSPAKLNAGVPSLLAQMWPPEEHGQHPPERTVRLRAKSVIKLGLFVAAIIGGLITFFIRLVSGKSKPESVTPRTGNAPEAGGSPASPFLPPVRNGPTAAAASVPGTSTPPDRFAAKPQQPDTDPTRAGNGRVIAVVAIGMSALLFVLLCCGGLMFLGYQMLTPSPAVNESVASSETLNLGPVIPVEPEVSPIDQRWQEPDRSHAEPVHTGELITEEPRPSFEELAAPESPISAISWDASELVDSGISLTRQGMSFDDVAPAGGVLVGLRVTGSGHRLQSVQPIYQLEDEYVLGKVHGQESGEQIAQFLAEPGDVVAAMRLDLVFRVEGIQVEFGRVTDSRVDLTETYASPFFGRRIANSSVVIESEGDVFVGMSGTIRDGFDGLSLKRNMAFGPCEDLQTEIDMSSWSTLPRAGGNAGNQFRDTAPDGGFLVGMRIFIGRSWGGAIQGVQPIYQVADRYQPGNRYGADGGLAHQVIARPGYAIGKIDARAGLVLNSVKLTFQRVTDSGLEATDVYESERFGSPGGGQYWLDSAGRLMIGLGGSFQEDMISLEAIVSGAPQ